MTSQAIAIVIAAIGVAIFMALDLPLPWLLGSMAACLIAALFGAPLQGVKAVNQAMRAVLGVAAGSSVTGVVLAGLVNTWPTLLILLMLMILIALIGVPYFSAIWGFDFPTSYYSAMPGGLQDMLVFGEEAGGNLRTLSLIHAVRVSVIASVVPFILSEFWEAELGSVPGRTVDMIGYDQLLIMLFCGLAGWQLAKALRLYGAVLLGPMLLAAAASLAGYLNAQPPAEIIWMAQFFIGSTIGSSYVGITVNEVRRDVAAGLGFSLILAVLTAGVVWLVVTMDLAGPKTALLAFAPGGQFEMTVFALIVGGDLAFVALHHIARLSMVILGAPVFAAMFASKFDRNKRR